MHYLNYVQDWGGGQTNVYGVFDDGIKGSWTDEENLNM